MRVKNEMELWYKTCPVRKEVVRAVIKVVANNRSRFIIMFLIMRMSGITPAQRQF